MGDVRTFLNLLIEATGTHLTDEQKKDPFLGTHVSPGIEGSGPADEVFKVGRACHA